MAKRFASTALSKDWSADQYLKFNTERTRPARDLLARVPLNKPHRVVDLGCGPGNSTTILAEKFPEAHLSGIDSSLDMINKARKTLPGIDFSVASLESFSPDSAVDLYFSNAVFQWLPAAELFPICQRLMRQLTPGGALAFQVPDNLSEGSHVAMRETAAMQGMPWSSKLADAGGMREAIPTPGAIYDALYPSSSTVDIWRTTYIHVMEGHSAIMEMVKSTGLRPFLDPLTADEERQFLDHYVSRLKEHYPIQGDGKVLLAFPRLFVVATAAQSASQP